jgi:hypothetical protein
MLGALQKQEKDSLGNDSISSKYPVRLLKTNKKCPANEEMEELKKSLSEYNDKINDGDQTGDGDQL